MRSATPLRLGAIGFDAVKHLVLCRIERRPPRLNLDVYPYLPRARVGDDVRQVVHEPAVGARRMTDTPQVLLAHHLKTLKLPTFLREYDKIARQCASEGVDHVRYLLRLAELELIDRERRMVERRIKAARFPVVKSLDSFDFKVIPSLNKALVLELARCEYIERRENLIALGNSGTGKTHIALGLGLAACQKGLSVGFITAAALVHELIEARDDKQLLRFQKKLATYKLLIVDELGFVPLSKTGAELLFEVFSQRYERGSTLVTTNLPFDEWTEVFGSERLTGALLDRLTHHVNILEMRTVTATGSTRAAGVHRAPREPHRARQQWEPATTHIAHGLGLATCQKGLSGRPPAPRRRVSLLRARRVPPRGATNSSRLRDDKPAAEPFQEEAPFLPTSF